MKNIKLFVEGFIIGIGKIIPGVSGAMFAMMFGVYEKALFIISNLKTELKKNIKFMLILGTGILLAIIIGSNIIKKSLDNYYLPTMLFFIGMMIAGIKPLFMKVNKEKVKKSDIITSLIVITLLGILSLINVEEKSIIVNESLALFIILILAGFLDAVATIVPGICGTALLMIMGYYNTVIGALSDLLNFNNLGSNLFILFPFCLGMTLGIFVISKIINYLFKNHKVKTYYSILGFAIMSIVILFTKLFGKNYNKNELIVSLLLFITGYLIVHFLEKNSKYN